ncbi:MAG: T9SS type A sorting domain-containing protein, partial [Bacteroidales bacterium]|nr:T9SS type A sorting domain-containing protein [Bacteroidales bacterium]
THQRAPQGTNPGEYSEDVKAALAAAIAEAQEAYNHQQITTHIANNAHAALTQALEAFSGAVNVATPINTTELEVLLDIIKNSVETGVRYTACYNDGYPLSAIETMTSALYTAKANLARAITQSDVDGIFSAILPKYTNFTSSWTEKEIECNTAIETVQDLALRVYPTLATSYITIDAVKEIRSIAIVSARGSVMAVEVPNAPQAIIDVANLAQGCYIVRVSCADGTVETQTIIKR